MELLAQSEKTKRELRKLLNRSDGISRHLLDLEKKGMIITSKIINKAKVWSITTEGVKVLKELDFSEQIKMVLTN